MNSFSLIMYNIVISVAMIVDMRANLNEGAKRTNHYQKYGTRWLKLCKLHFNYISIRGRIKISNFHQLCVNISHLRTSILAAAYISNIFTPTLVETLHA